MMFQELLSFFKDVYTLKLSQKKWTQANETAQEPNFSEHNFICGSLLGFVNVLVFLLLTNTVRRTN